MRRPTIAEAAVAVLTEAGPLPAVELGRRVAELGATTSRNPAAAVKQALATESRVVRLSDGRFTLTTLALDGLVLTHRLTEAEVANWRVALEPDLGPIAALTSDGLRLASGGEVEQCDDGYLHGPAGWLGDAAPGGLRAFRLRGGRLDVGPVALESGAVAAAQAVLAVVRAELERRRGLPARIGPTLRAAAVTMPDLLRDAVAPLGELLAALGMAVRAGLVYPPGVDPDDRASAAHAGPQPAPPPLPPLPPFPPVPPLPPLPPVPPLPPAPGRSGLPAEPGVPGVPGVPRVPGVPGVPGLPSVREALAERVVGRLAAQFGVDAHAVDGLTLIMQAVELGDSEPEVLAQLDAEQGLLGELGAILAYPGVAELVRFAIAAEPVAAERLLTELMHAVPAPLNAAPIWLLARLAEARADALTAETLDLRAISADPAFVPALLDAARAAEDRSDARTASYYLRRAGGESDHPHLVRLERYARLSRRRPADGGPAGPPDDLGPDSAGLGSDRFCGMGRVAIPTAPLPARASWLVDKALGWSLLPVNRPAVAQLAALLPNAPTAVLAQDTILFDRGMLARYLRARAQIIPLDEFELARDWLVTERSLWSVEAAHPGGHLVLRNVRTGELAEITERSGRPLPARGELRYGRVVPDGRDRLLLSGGTHVPAPLRAAFLFLLTHQPDGATILAWFEEVYRDLEGLGDPEA